MLGALQIPPGEDHLSLCAGIDHRVGIRQPCGNRLVGGDPLDTGLRARDDSLLHEFRGGYHGGDVRDDALHHLVRITIERLDTETFTDDLSPIGIPLGDRNDFRVGHGSVNLGIVLSHPAAPYDSNPELFLRAWTGFFVGFSSHEDSPHAAHQETPTINITHKYFSE